MPPVQSRAPEIHEAHLEPGVSAWLRSTWRARCECGWKGLWTEFKSLAQAERDEHLDEADARV